MTVPATSGHDVRAALRDGVEIALIDVRAESAFASGHPLFAASFPLSRLELGLHDRLPRREVSIVVCDDGGGLSARAVERLVALGYSRVSILDGGVEGWTQGGGELFRDVNVPSKAFGELVEARAKTPSISADELDALLGGGGDVVILDVRTHDEFGTMSIPQAVNVPGGELVLRVESVVPSPETLVVVNCAGRTRSIIGTQSLVNARIPNRVVALRNGTIGWTLAGHQLDEGANAQAPPIDDQQRRRAAARARAVAERAGVALVDAEALDELHAAPDRTVYLFDVRTPGEFAAGSLAGFRSAPGGQLVQRTDDFAPVRGACIVLSDDDGTRANMTASWLAQMGWDVRVVDPESASRPSLRAEGPWASRGPAAPPVDSMEPGEVRARLEADAAVVVDIDTSAAYRAGHVPGAVFVARDDLEGFAATVPPTRVLVVTSSDGVLAAFAVAEHTRLGGLRGPAGAVRVLGGGTGRWRDLVGPLETGAGRNVSPFDDVYVRPYEGTGVEPAVMQDYLDWEFGLVAQLHRDGTHGFRPLDEP